MIVSDCRPPVTQSAPPSRNQYRQGTGHDPAVHATTFPRDDLSVRMDRYRFGYVNPDPGAGAHVDLVESHVTSRQRSGRHDQGTTWADVSHRADVQHAVEQ